MSSTNSIFVTGANGYIGQALIRELCRSGKKVHALVRAESMYQFPAECTRVVGNALQSDTYCEAIPDGATFVHLVGVSKPSPFKAQQFIDIDLTSVCAGLEAAAYAGVKHFVYISVAQPPPVMQAYQRVRAEAEILIANSGLSATILRPWYILGPGHQWPYVLWPFYVLFNMMPGFRQHTKRLGLLTLEQMVCALMSLIREPRLCLDVMNVPDIKQAAATYKIKSSINRLMNV